MIFQSQQLEHRPSVFGRVRAAVKYLLYGSGYGSPWSYDIGSYSYGTTVDYRSRAGELTENAIVMACVRWIMLNFAMPTRVMRTVGDKPQEQPTHPLTRLLNTPNEYYSGELLMRSTALSLALANNAYWLVWPNSRGMPVELWYEPHHTIRCAYPGGYNPDLPFISHYEILRDGQWYRVEKENVIHFRDSLDPRNPRMGLFVLGAALREVFTDNEAANYTATVLSNMGVTSMIVSPKEGGKSIARPDELKRAIMASNQGDRRGEPMVMSDAVNVQVPAFSPQQMDVANIRDIPEERIAALLGPGLVIAAGLGAGLERSTFHNVGEAVASAFRNNIMPTHRIVAGQINTQLLPRLGNPNTEYVEFDLTTVPELQEDRDAKAKRFTEAIKAGVPVFVNEARELLDLPPIPERENELVVPPPYIMGLPLASADQLPPPAPEPTPTPPDAQDMADMADNMPPGKALMLATESTNGHRSNGHK